MWQGQSYEGLTCDALEWVNSSGGGQIISPEQVITIYNPAAVDIISRAAEWVGTISPTGVTGFQEEDTRNFFQAGNAAFMRNWPYAYSPMSAEAARRWQFRRHAAARRSKRQFGCMLGRLELERLALQPEP